MLGLPLLCLEPGDKGLPLVEDRQLERHEWTEHTGAVRVLVRVDTHLEATDEPAAASEPHGLGHQESLLPRRVDVETPPHRQSLEVIERWVRCRRRLQLAGELPGARAFIS